jgi:hypothetical protein
VTKEALELTVEPARANRQLPSGRADRYGYYTVPKTDKFRKAFSLENIFFKLRIMKILFF